MYSLTSSLTHALGFSLTNPPHSLPRSLILTAHDDDNPDDHDFVTAIPDKTDASDENEPKGVGLHTPWMAGSAIAFAAVDRVDLI